MFYRALGLFASLAALSGPWLAPPAAQACGGFFCSRRPVDQTAERIVFSVNPNGTVTARVQIRYVGERDAFAWLLPVAGVPELEVFPELAVQAIDLATEPRYQSFACGALLLDGGGGPGHATPLLREAVGPFDTVVLQGDSAQAIVDWLRDNDYRISDAMVPLIEPYVTQGLNFVAMKLLPDADVTDIAPIALTYEGTRPTIPLRLTAVAAQPEMGVIALVLADRRYQALNYANFVVDDADIRFSRSGDCNYLPLVSRRIDELGGRAFATEYAGPTQALIEAFESAPVPDDPDAQAANATVLDLLREHPYVTRLYARLSAHEMTVDPVFGPAATDDAVSNTHVLEGTESDECSEELCDFVYCGESASCQVSEAGAVCVCDAATTARMTQDRFGRAAVHCEPMTSDLLARSGAGAAPDPCASYECGPGAECAPMNGNPTCRCGGGGARIDRVSSDGALGVVCEGFEAPPLEPPAQVQPFGQVPDAGAESALDAGSAAVEGDAGASAPAADSGIGLVCHATPRRGAAWAGAWLLVLGALIRARRRCRAVPRTR